MHHRLQATSEGIGLHARPVRCDDSLASVRAQSSHAEGGAEPALAVAEDGRYAQAVREEQKIWLDKEVHAVPAFLFNEKYMVPGAQEAETFVRILNKIQA